MVQKNKAQRHLLAVHHPQDHCQASFFIPKNRKSKMVSYKKKYKIEGEMELDEVHYYDSENES